MNEIQSFSDERFGTVRAIAIDNEPWFVAKDVCDALGIATNHLRESGRGLDDDEVLSLPNWEGKGSAPLIVSEAGFYKLVLRSRKPEAKAFQRWVTHDVLPAIRRTGGYMVSRDETPEQTMARALIIAQDTMERQRKQIDALRPKALFADAVAASDGTCLVGELAKMLSQAGFKVGQNGLFEILRRDGYLISGNRSDRNMPTQRSQDMGLFKIKETAITHADGHVTLNRTPKVTGKGQSYFMRRYANAERL